MNDDEITIRSVQHYLYCPHRWGLLEIDRAWSENAFVTKANIMHERVHNPDMNYTIRGKKVFTSVYVYNDTPDYGLCGVTDCIEATTDKNGISIGGSIEKYSLCIVEYKPTKPKNAEFNEDDAMQVFAQKICADKIFHTNCKAVLYYADVNKRVGLPFLTQYSEYNEKLKKVLSEMREYITNGIIPPVSRGQKCSGCSMKDVCMPSIKKAESIQNRILCLEEEII